jgi:hypothetical protein
MTRVLSLPTLALAFALNSTQMNVYFVFCHNDLSFSGEHSKVSRRLLLRTEDAQTLCLF